MIGLLIGGLLRIPPPADAAPAEEAAGELLVRGSPGPAGLDVEGAQRAKPVVGGVGAIARIDA